MPSSLLFATQEEAEHYLEEAMEQTDGEKGDDVGGGADDGDHKEDADDKRR